VERGPTYFKKSKQKCIYNAGVPIQVQISRTLSERNSKENPNNIFTKGSKYE
jgi:hypothetical protein